MVAVAVPNAQRRLQAFQEFRGWVNLELGEPVFPAPGGFHPSAELLGNPLQPIANTEHRDVQLQDPLVTDRSGRVVNRRRAAGKHQGLRVHPEQLIERDMAGDDERIDLHLADAASYQLRILRTEIENDNWTRMFHLNRR